MPNIIDKTKLTKVFTGASYNRGNGQPLDDTVVWSSYDDLVKYAADSSERSYAGQVVAVVSGSNTDVYVITSTSQGTKTINGKSYNVYLQAVAGAINSEVLNAAIADKLSGKLDKLSSTADGGGTYAYTVKGDTQSKTRVNVNVSRGTIVMRVDSTNANDSGQIKVPLLPWKDEHAASKSYVDTTVANSRKELVWVNSSGSLQPTDQVIAFKIKGGARLTTWKDSAWVNCYEFVPGDQMTPTIVTMSGYLNPGTEYSASTGYHYTQPILCQRTLAAIDNKAYTASLSFKIGGVYQGGIPKIVGFMYSSEDSVGQGLAKVSDTAVTIGFSPLADPSQQLKLTTAIPEVLVYRDVVV